MKRPFRKLVLILLCVIAVVTLGWFFGPSGRVSGIEFSPDSFSHRSFTYFQWCGIQCTPQQHNEWQSDVEGFLHESGFVTPTEQQRWHFVNGFAPGIRGWYGNAKYMCQAVGCWGRDDQWVQWSRNNPELSTVVWPQVVIWARQEKYFEIMCLFRFTELENAISTDDVKSKIAAAIAKANS